MPIFNRKFFSILCLGFASGLPLGLLSSTLQAWYTVSGASLIAIGWLSLIGQPYAFKFLWAPLLDRFAWFGMGKRRSWIAIMQGALCIALLGIAYGNPTKIPIGLAVIALLAAIFSATQDTAIDAYRTEILTEKERGLGVALNTIAYRFAMIVSTALALIIAAKLSFQETYLIMSASFFLLLFITLNAPNPAENLQAPSTLRIAMIAPCKEILSRKYIGWIFIFIILYKLCDAMALSLNTTFLIRGVGFSLVEIGAISKMIGLLASLLGSIVGGLLLSRLGLYRSLMGFGFLQTTSNLLYAWLAFVGKNMWVMGIAMFGEYFCGGLATVAFIVFLMQLCDQRYTATHYALFSAIAALPRIFIGPLSAVIVTHVGWIDFYVISSLIGLPALWILQRLRTHDLSLPLNGIQQIKTIA